MTIEKSLERIADALEALAAGGGAPAPAAKAKKPKNEKAESKKKDPEPEPETEDTDAGDTDTEELPSQDDVNAAAMALNTAKNRDALLDALKHVGVEGAGTTAIEEGKRAEFIAKCDELKAAD